MSDGLRIMIYDSTDIKGWTEGLKKRGPEVAGDLVEQFDIEVGLSPTWSAGGKMYRSFGRFDHVKGFESWKDALEWIIDLEPTEVIDEIQFWGHGSPGKAWINGVPVHYRSFSDPVLGPLLRNLKVRLHEDSLIWFRACSVFCSARGHRFAKSWAGNLGCRIAAHTYIVGFWQSGLYCIKPGQEPWWQMLEGVDKGSVDNPEAIKWSMPWTPRGIFALRSHLPDWASE